MTLHDLEFDIFDIKLKLGNAGLPVIVGDDANMSLSPNLCLDDATCSTSKRILYGPLALTGNHKEVDRKLFASFCHVVGLRSTNTWSWDNSAQSQIGQNTWFSKRNLGSVGQIDHILTTCHFISQARTLIHSPTRKALWERFDHYPILSKLLLLEDDGKGVFVTIGIWMTLLGNL